MNARRLSLRSEALSDLTTDELTGVVGGALPTSPVRECPYLNESIRWCIAATPLCPTTEAL